MRRDRGLVGDEPSGARLLAPSGDLALPARHAVLRHPRPAARRFRGQPVSAGRQRLAVDAPRRDMVLRGGRRPRRARLDTPSRTVRNGRRGGARRVRLVSCACADAAAVGRRRDDSLARRELSLRRGHLRLGPLGPRLRRTRSSGARRDRRRGRDPVFPPRLLYRNFLRGARARLPPATARAPLPRRRRLFVRHVRARVPGAAALRLAAGHQRAAAAVRPRRGGDAAACDAVMAFRREAGARAEGSPVANGTASAGRRGSRHPVVGRSVERAGRHGLRRTTRS